MFKFGFNLLITLIVGFLIMIFGLAYIQLSQNIESPKSQLIDSYGWCGTCNKYLRSERAGEGKTLFINNCASCHAKDMKSVLTGPALEDFFWYWKKDTNEVAKYLRNTIEYLDTSSNEHLLKVDKEFGSTISTSFPDLTYEEVRAIIEYIEL